MSVYEIEWKLCLLIYFQTVKMDKKRWRICAKCTKGKKCKIVTSQEIVDNFLNGKVRQVEKSHETGVIHKIIHVIHEMKPRLSNEKKRQGWKFVLLRTYKSQKVEKIELFYWQRCCHKNTEKKLELSNE